jgi:hypothetical protein
MDYNKFLKELQSLIDQTTVYRPPVGNSISNYDSTVDVPDLDDPSPFVTHRAIGEEADDVKEQSAEGRDIGVPPQTQTKLATEQDAAINPAEAGADAGAEAGAQAGAEDMEGGLPADMGGADMGGDMGSDMPGGDMAGGMGGVGEQEEKLTSSQIGRVYELKKIYSRLSSVESYLARAMDESILELRKYVAQSIDLFEVVISNYDQYKDKVDDIIVNFYEFLDVIYSSLRKYYKGMSD